MAAQPRVTIAETFERLTPLWDDLARRAGLPRTAGQHDQLEHDWQRFRDVIDVAFRGPGARRSSAPPIKITDNGARF